MVDLVRGFQDPDSASKGLSWIQKDPSDKKDYQRDWSDPVNYHMTLNSGLLGLSGVTDVIVARARSLGW